MYRNLSCPNCEEKILSSDINLNKMIAKCSSCHVVFDLEKELQLEDEEKVPGIRKEEIFVIPRGIEVLKMMSELEITMSWRQTASKFLMFFTLMWNGILFPMALFIILSGQFMILIFLGIHLTIGLWLLYQTISTLFNKTYIYVDANYISIQHRPFNLFHKEYQLETHTVDQLYVKKYSNGSTNGVPNIVFAIMAILKNKEEVQILKNIGKTDQALYIEQQIEQFAGIKDRPVAGEV